MEIIVFYLFAFIAVLGALGVVLLRNPVHSAVSLALVFISLAAMYVLLSAPFIAVAQVMVYAGAILILFVFVMMLLNPGTDRGAGKLPSQRWLAIIFGVVLFIQLAVTLASVVVPTTAGTFTPELIANQGGVQVIGMALFTDFLLPFEITSMLLLIAIVGVIVLAKKPKNS
jgi:NADH-quinone oxidoreductase subunit J